MATRLDRKFSGEQLAAISVARLGEDACIVAGPGSGKTTVLVERYKQLVQDRGIPASRILAITFTEKAASNMRERLGKQLGTQLDTANVSTVHGFCYRLIREHAIEAGVDPGASILEEGKGILLRRQCLDRALDSFLSEQPQAARSLIRSLGPDISGLLDAYDAIRSAGANVASLRNASVPAASEARQEIRQLIEEIRALPLKSEQKAKLAMLYTWHERLCSCEDELSFRSHLQTEAFKLTLVRNETVSTAVKRIRILQQELLSDCVTRMHAADREALISVLERFDDFYAHAKRERGMLDFADLEFYAVRLLETHPEIRSKLQQHFIQIMMDEFQDTNGQQEKLMALLRGADNFYAVGDINQSIFGFRHTTPEVFRRHRDLVEQSGKHYVELVENWRSRPEILLAVETLLDQREGIVPRRLIAAKKRVAKRVSSVEVIAVEQTEDQDGTAIEAAWVAQRMLELRGTLTIGDRKARFGDMAVLVRNSAVFGAFAAAFEKAGVRYVQSRKRGFLQTREALDLTHLLRTISNPRDEISLAVVLRSPLVALSNESILRLETIAPNLGDALARLTESQAAQFEELDRERLMEFQRNLELWREAQPHISFDRLLLRALDDCASPYEPNTDQGTTIDKFLEIARAADVPLAEFVEELELLREVDTGEPEAPLDTENDAVKMMTAHSAKGLEFPIVFVSSLNKGTRMDSPPFSFTQEGGFGTSWRSSYDEKAQPDAFHSANCTVITAREEQESNRLLYVALTRAEEHLILSYSTDQKSQNWAGHIRKLLVKPFDVPLDQPTEVQVASPNQTQFGVRVIRTAHAPEAEQASFTFEESSGVTYLKRPKLVEQHDSAVTVTALSTFAACPRRYFLAHELGWEQKRPVRLAERGEEFETGSIPASELGREVHRLLAGEVFAASGVAEDLARNFREHPLGLRASVATQVQREWSFNFAVDDIVVSGQIDLWFVEEGGLVLVDYKTNDINPQEARNSAHDYETQIDLYALCLTSATGMPVRAAYLHFLRPNAVVEMVPDATRAVSVVRQLAEAQEDCDFPLHVREHCLRCPFYKNLCPADLNSSQAED